MAQGLSVDDVANVTINMSPAPSAQRNFGVLLIAGSSNVIDVQERIRQYSDINGVASDFPPSAPEYQAASAFFAQSPQPSILDIGRWARTATSGMLRGAIFSAAQQISLLTTLQGINNGSFAIQIDGVQKTVTGLNFSSIITLNGAASIINAQLTGATVAWMPDSNARFVVTSNTVGATSLVSFATATGAGTDVSNTLGLTAAAGGYTVSGQAAETPLSAVQAFDSGSSIFAGWYGFIFADSTVTDNQHLSVAGYIEASATTHIYGITTSESQALDPNQTTDIGSAIKALGYRRTFTQYSSSSPYAAVSAFARAFTVDFTANNSTITLKFKQEPGIVPETLTETQAAALRAKNINVFVNYNNATAIIQEGVMGNGFFFDEVHGTDWLQNNVQNAVFNLLYTSPTKIPQTDPGVHEIVTVVSNAMSDGVNNGLIAPGLWTGPAIGSLTTGSMLTLGYYVYAPSVSSQNPADRAARKAPTIQAAIKLAGAVHFANVLISVNR